MGRCVEYWDRKVRKSGILDVTMAQGAAIGATLIVVKLFAQVLGLSLWWFVALVVVCGLEVYYVLWFETEHPGSGPARGSLSSLPERSAAAGPAG